jgi:hypothetical protein
MSTHGGPVLDPESIEEFISEFFRDNVGFFERPLENLKEGRQLAQLSSRFPEGLVRKPRIALFNSNSPLAWEENESSRGDVLFNLYKSTTINKLIDSTILHKEFFKAGPYMNILVCLYSTEDGAYKAIAGCTFLPSDKHEVKIEGAAVIDNIKGFCFRRQGFMTFLLQVAYQVNRRFHRDAPQARDHDVISCLVPEEVANKDDESSCCFLEALRFQRANDDQPAGAENGGTKYVLQGMCFSL